MNKIKMEDFSDWIYHNYSAVEFIWRLIHSEMSKLGYKMNDDIDYNKEKFMKLSYLLYHSNNSIYDF
jgi:hypothetical protein